MTFWYANPEIKTNSMEHPPIKYPPEFALIFIFIGFDPKLYGDCI